MCDVVFANLFVGGDLSVRSTDWQNAANIVLVVSTAGGRQDHEAQCQLQRASVSAMSSSTPWCLVHTHARSAATDICRTPPCRTPHISPSSGQQAGWA